MIVTPTPSVIALLPRSVRCQPGALYVTLTPQVAALSTESTLSSTADVTRAIQATAGLVNGWVGGGGLGCLTVIECCFGLDCCFDLTVVFDWVFSASYPPQDKLVNVLPKPRRRRHLRWALRCYRLFNQRIDHTFNTHLQSPFRPWPLHYLWDPKLPAPVGGTPAISI